MVKVEAKNFNVDLGSNKAINCNGVINLVGKGLNKQPLRFREGDDGKILLNCTLRNKKGDPIVVLNNSNSIQNLPTKDEYDTKIENKRIVVTNKTTKEILLDFKEISPNHFKITGIFYFPDIKILITDEFMEITTKTNRLKTSGQKNINCLNVVNIGPDGSIWVD
ncbi:hypothetical protein [Methanobacterium spitsbergense]|uniref:Uncharacterized protein n=1 Tax=Methanobacterium spitsbergense TaxID=2874285 RepID=A0A8T5V5V3_9EURY|nr:hypothetical protein [Methanobacterium spitsbergense]MBZ2167025.1 hypothetical protein [Methanobacterium spitsbergense]